MYSHVNIISNDSDPSPYSIPAIDMDFAHSQPEQQNHCSRLLSNKDVASCFRHLSLALPYQAICSLYSVTRITDLVMPNGLSFPPQHFGIKTGTKTRFHYICRYYAYNKCNQLNIAKMCTW